MNHTLDISAESDALKNTFVEEMNRAARQADQPLLPAEAYAAADIKAYAKACQEFLGKGEIIPDEFLERLKAMADEESRLKEYVPEGYTLCLAVLPFSPLGNPWTEEEKAEGRHLKWLLVNPEGKTFNASAHPSGVSRLLPTEVLEQCSFVIPPYENPRDPNPSPADRERLKASLERAFRNLKGLLNDEYVLMER